jgi:hypothetical protein
MKRALIRHRFLELFDELFAPLVLLNAREEGKDLIVEVNTGERNIRFRCVEVNRGTPTMLKLAVQRVPPRKADASEFPALIAPWLSANALESCALAGISCFDLSGNALVCSEEPPIRQHGDRSEASTETPIFSGKGARVIQTLLVNPKREWTVRALGEEAQTSIGLVSQVTQILAHQGWLSVKRGRGGVHLLSPGALIDAWCQHYVPDVTATLNLFTLEDLGEAEQKLVWACERMNLQYAFTGSSAAALLNIVNVRHEAAFYVYPAAVPLKALVQLAGMLRFNSTAGNILLLAARSKAFLYGAHKTPSGWVVHPVQAYLDLWIDSQNRTRAATFREATLDF